MYEWFLPSIYPRNDRDDGPDRVIELHVDAPEQMVSVHFLFHHDFKKESVNSIVLSVQICYTKSYRLNK